MQKLIPFKEYLWQEMKQPLWTSWIVIVLFSLTVYSSVIYLLKNNQLMSHLNVASFTVNHAIEAGDWSLALAHLEELQKQGPIYEITLRDRNGHKNIAGPFGEFHTGLGSICSETQNQTTYVVNGCMRFIGPSETYTFLLFIIFSCLVFYFSYRLLKLQSLRFVSHVSDELESMVKSSPCAPQNTPIRELNSISTHIQKLRQTIEKTTQFKALTELSLKVAHDIRSPLAVLDTLVIDIEKIPENKRVMLREATKRIKDIANQLIEKNRSSISQPENSLSSEHMLNHLEAIISEKRVQYQNRDGVVIDLHHGKEAYAFFSIINTEEFKRVISNLIDNSVQSILSEGSIKVSVCKENNTNIISIHDTGHGIPRNELNKVFSKGYSYKKSDGSGLGLYYAKKHTHSWGGDIFIESDGMSYTNINITLPCSQPPKWYLECIDLSCVTRILVLDDDPSIHEIWKNRFSDFNVNLFHAYNISDATSWLKNYSSRGTLFLIDYEIINHNKSGLDFILENKIEIDSILVTSLYEEGNITETCIKKRIKLLPKGLAGIIPIEKPTHQEAHILIDDDPIIHMLWKEKAKIHKKRLVCFFSVADFLAQCSQFKKESKVYIDSHLSEKMKGEQVSKDIYDSGFENISLISGQNIDISNFPWITDFSPDKTPPWKTING